MPKNDNKIIGAFTLRNEGDGCLTSKYHHGDSLQGPFTEVCKLTTPLNVGDVFVGTYRTVWLEDNNNHVTAQLTIQRHQRNNNIFQLFWRDTNAILLFEGTAMTFENFLVGTYWH